MTIICTDGDTVASDSLVTFGNERGVKDGVKMVVDDGRIYAASGLYCLPALVRWHKADADVRNLPVIEGDDAWALLVIEPSGMTYYSKALPYPTPVAPPFALGTGCDFALGAMYAGGSPREAAEIACRLDIKCGGAIQVVNIAEALGLDKIREAAE
jgi:hypothetical protein